MFSVSPYRSSKRSFDPCKRQMSPPDGVVFGCCSGSVIFKLQYQTRLPKEGKKCQPNKIRDTTISSLVARLLRFDPMESTMLYALSLDKVITCLCGNDKPRWTVYTISLLCTCIITYLTLCRKFLYMYVTKWGGQRLVSYP